jgi:hypothetical protein
MPLFPSEFPEPLGGAVVLDVEEEVEIGAKWSPAEPSAAFKSSSISCCSS